MDIKIPTLVERKVSNKGRYYGAGVLLRYPVCALPTARLRCTPTAATRSGRCICHRQRSPRSPDSHLRFESDRKAKKQIPKWVSAFLVPVTGLEPVRCRQRWILSPLRLPFHHTGRCLDSIIQFGENSKCFFSFSEKGGTRRCRPDDIFGQWLITFSR